MTLTTRAMRLAPVLACALLGACAAPANPTAPSVAIPDNLRAPANETLQRTLSADGVQIYECRAKAADAAAAEWVFVAPEAKLFDAGGAQVGKHYGGPTWEAMDGSKVVGVVKAKADAPAGDRLHHGDDRPGRTRAVPGAIHAVRAGILSAARREAPAVRPTTPAVPPR